LSKFRKQPERQYVSGNFIAAPDLLEFTRSLKKAPILAIGIFSY